MSFTRKKTADVNTSSTVKAAKRAQKASSAAAANAANAAQNAALTAQNAAGVAQVAAQNAAVVATNAAQTRKRRRPDGRHRREQGRQARGLHRPELGGTAPRDAPPTTATTTVAPKVSSALHTTARQVRPVERTKSKRSSMLTWSVLGAAILAALGAAAAVARYRYRAAIAAESEEADEEVLADSAGSQAAPASPDGRGPRPRSQGPGH